MENKNRNIIMYIIIGVLIVVIGVSTFVYLNRNKKEVTEKVLKNTTVDLSHSTFNSKELKVYTQDDFETFKNDYKNNFLDDIYLTEFLFDGVGMYKPYDLDDFIEKGNDYTVEPLKINVININTVGNIELSGELTGMIAVNSNVLNDEVNLILNGVKIDTDSKKVPAIYVYNKDITNTTSKVTIVAKENTKNYIEGGKLKKVSLIGSDELDNYSNKYTGSDYANYTNYYGVYKTSELNDILFAKITADNDDLKDGDPYYFYKAAGAISSDIDLYFNGSGYLEVTSKNKEGIETKGNLEFSGGIGDYVINAEDDCLNTTTKSSSNKNARNTLTINVKSLTAIVSNDADEGDAIDSNGELYINGGNIIAIAKPGADAGIDSETGTYINSGEVIATGDMVDAISNSSKQNFVVLSFKEKVQKDTLITLLDSNENVVFSYKTDREYTNLVFSSSKLVNGTYYLYRDGNIDGTISNGLYTTVNSYDKGTQLGYANSGLMSGPGGMGGNGRPEMPNGQAPSDNTDRQMPNDENRQMPSGERPSDNGTRPEMPNGQNNNSSNMNSSNKEFTINGISNGFNGIGTLT